MKKVLFLMLCGMVLLTACQPGKSTKKVTEADLAHRRFELVTMNGKALQGQSDAVAEISFGENMHVSGKACNRFTGKAIIADGKLSVPAAASTKMFCAQEDLNALETALFTMFNKGTAITLEGDSLTLKDSDNTLVYKRRDLVD